MRLKKNKKFMAGLVLAALMISSSGYGKEDEESQFSGFIMFGGAYSSGELSKDDASDENRKIDSLSGSSKYLSDLSPLVMGSLSYGFANTGTKITIGGEGKGIGISFLQRTGSAGDFGLGLSFSNDSVFKDPFLTGIKRDITDMDSMHYNLSWNEIFETDLSFEYSLTTMNIDDDLAGKRNKKLERDGNIHSFSVVHPVFGTENQVVTAGFSYEIGDISGGANAFKGPGFLISHGYSAGRWEIETEFSYILHDFEKVHPVFNKTRHDNGFEIGTKYTFYQPFDMENFFVNTGISYSRNESNLDFYDSSGIASFAGFGFSF